MAHILLVGENGERVSGLRTLLRQDGHRTDWVREVRRWREVEGDAVPDLVVAAVASSGDVLAAPGRASRGFPAPLLFVHHDVDPFGEAQLDDRLLDRIESPFMAEEFLGRVDALVRVRRVILRQIPEEAPREKEGRRALRAIASGMRAILGSRVPRYAKPRAPYLEVAVRVADWADRRDGFEPGHAERVASLAALVADALGLPDDDVPEVLRAALLHDIGKVALPAEILQQTTPLEESQLRLLRTHAERGAKLLRALDRDEGVARAVELHHEHVDGSGYLGKRGDEIPLAARIVAVAEAFDAMTMSRVRPCLNREGALSELRNRRGRHFDDDCVDALTKSLRPRPVSVALSH